MAKKVMQIKDGKRVWVDPKEKKSKPAKQQDDQKEAK